MQTDRSSDLARCAAASHNAEPGIPRQNGEPVFASPWEARAFGLAVALNEKGAYAWRDFSSRLADEIGSADRLGDPSTYYERWLAALEKLLVIHGLIREDELQNRIVEYASGIHDDHHHEDH